MSKEYNPFDDDVAIFEYVSDHEDDFLDWCLRQGYYQAYVEFKDAHYTQWAQERHDDIVSEPVDEE